MSTTKPNPHFAIPNYVNGLTQPLDMIAEELETLGSTHIAASIREASEVCANYVHYTHKVVAKSNHDDESMSDIVICAVFHERTGQLICDMFNKGANDLTDRWYVVRPINAKDHIFEP